MGKSLKRKIHSKKNITLKKYNNEKIKGINVLGKASNQVIEIEKYNKEGQIQVLKRLFRDKNLNRLEDISIDEKDYTKFADTIKKEFYELKKNKDYNPSEDYYDYVNHGWLKEETKKLKEDPKYYVEVDDFRVVQDKVYDEVLAYTNEYIKQNKGKRKAESIKAVQHCIVKADKKLGLKHANTIKEAIQEYIIKKLLL